jgi:hypothetical protein
MQKIFVRNANYFKRVGALRLEFLSPTNDL